MFREKNNYLKIVPVPHPSTAPCRLRHNLLHPGACILYLASMKAHCLLATLLLLSACGGHRMSHRLARNTIVGSPQAVLEKKDVEVVTIRQSSASEAIVEARLSTAFRMEKEGTHWIVREIRIGHGQWERVDNLDQTLQRIKEEDTRRMLDRIADAILRYREREGRFPVFADYVSLSDLLTPRFLTPLIRLDAWQRPLDAHTEGPKAILLRSAGPDGLADTKDDVRRLVEDK